MTLSFGWEKPADILADPEFGRLVAEYWEELSPHKGIAPIALDTSRMLYLADAGIFRVWTARESGALIGFVSFYVQPHLNYRHTLFALDAGHYLDPTYREDHWLGVKMWRSALKSLKEDGVKVVVAHDNSKLPLAPFFKRLGFEQRSTLYSRAL